MDLEESAVEVITGGNMQLFQVIPMYGRIAGREI